jgi:hypothetical protein
VEAFIDLLKVAVMVVVTATPVALEEGVVWMTMGFVAPPPMAKFMDMAAALKLLRFIADEVPSHQWAWGVELSFRMLV